MFQDYHLRFRQKHPPGWRYVLHTTEDYIKYGQDWPVNVMKRQRKEKERKEKEEKEKAEKDTQTESERRKNCGENQTHNQAHAADQRGSSEDGSQGEQKQNDMEPLEKYSPQEVSLLRLLQWESNYMKTLDENDGTVKSPIAQMDSQEMSIDEADQFTPDNWIPRSSHLIRLTGKHPLNGEPELAALWEAGLITPNHLHYVRNHGHVPHLLWESHKIDIDNGKLVLSMDDLANAFESINIAVAMACDGNRRKELNMIRRSKGFNWGASAISCAFWKGPLLRDVLLAAGIDEHDTSYQGHPRWVHFEGADELSNGNYATSIPLVYAMDVENDVILAYEMNDTRLPPDHGYPVRVIIPGYIGGRCVKWLHRIWISDKENDSYYHIWDNRVLPSFILDQESEFAHTMFNHPSTACNEQNLNSIIVRPSHGEKITLSEMRKDQSYRIAGIAYDGGGHEVQRVEVSLDGGESWLYCIRNVSPHILLVIIDQMANLFVSSFLNILSAMGESFGLGFIGVWMFHCLISFELRVLLSAVSMYSRTRNQRLLHGTLQGKSLRLAR